MNCTVFISLLASLLHKLFPELFILFFLEPHAWFHLLAIIPLCFSVRNLCLGIGERTHLSPEECPPTLITVALTSALCVGVCVCILPKPSLERTPQGMWIRAAAFPVVCLKTAWIFGHLAPAFAHGSKLPQGR